MFVLQAGGSEAGIDFGVCHNPEFLREGAAIDDFMRPDRVVIGSSDEDAIAIMRDLYRPLYLIETPIVITSLEAAELTKYAAMKPSLSADSSVPEPASSATCPDSPLPCRYSAT